MAESRTSPSLDGRRQLWWAIAFAALLAVAGIALPVAAWVVEGIAGTAENWILPLQVVIVLGVAAAFALVRSQPGHRRRALTATLVAAAGALVVADLVWWLLLAG